MPDLSPDDLVRLVRGVFSPGPTDTRLMILVDLPDERVPDNPAWAQRRALAYQWARSLVPRAADAGIAGVDLVLYGNVGTNNGDLPAAAVVYGGGPVPQHARELRGDPVPFDTLYATHSLVMAPTEFSTTAPLKNAARGRNLRAATMPGFSADMIPALQIDYDRVGRRVERLQGLLTTAEGCSVQLRAGGVVYDLHLDLRHRTAHASSGRFPSPGVAGNLPSGEAYVVPYEGENPGEPSRSEGRLPVQLGDEVVVYEIAENRARRVHGEGPMARAEARAILEEPAYANIAELGLGVLDAFGLLPIGELLLDEKLGLHIAFGRSDHFGGVVGPQQFSAPGKVVHIDRVYVPALQPLVHVVAVSLCMSDGTWLPLLRDGAYVVDFDV